MKLIILIIFVFIVSCKKTNKNEITNSQVKVDKRHTTILKDHKNISKDNFSEFSKKFQEKALPLKIEFKGENWFDFSTDIELNEIDRISAVKYLLNDNKNKLYQADGGIRQFYYGYKITFPNKNIGLVYYRTDQEYIGFVMTTYNSNGKYIEDKFIAGSKGEYDIVAQKDVLIDEKGVIEIYEIKIFNNNDLNTANLDFTKYDANFNEIKKKDNQIVKINIDQNTGRINIPQLSEEF